jgi:ribosomal protein S20
MADEERLLLDTPTVRKMVAKIKKGDQDNAADIARVEQELDDVSEKGLVVLNGQLRFY